MATGETLEKTEVLGPARPASADPDQLQPPPADKRWTSPTPPIDHLTSSQSVSPYSQVGSVPLTPPRLPQNALPSAPPPSSANQEVPVDGRSPAHSPIGNPQHSLSSSDSNTLANNHQNPVVTRSGCIKRLPHRYKAAMATLQNSHPPVCWLVQ